MAETPITALKKRIRSATPPDAPKNINFGEDSGIILDGPIFSPTAKPDLKKKKKGGDNTMSQNDDSDTGSDPNNNKDKMASPTEHKQSDESSVVERGDLSTKSDKNAEISSNPGGVGQRIRLHARRGKAGNKPSGIDEESAPDEQTEPKPRRGRPKKITLSVDPISSSRDVFSMLMDIRNELEIQKEVNLTIKGEMVSDITKKLEKLKTDVCCDLNVVQNDVLNQSVLLKKLDNAQNVQVERVVELETKCDEIDNELIKQRIELDKVSVDINDRTTRLEHSLAEHIETIRGNIEVEIHGQSSFQLNLEQKVSDLTMELDVENKCMRMDLDALKKKMEYLQNKSFDVDSWGKVSHSTSKGAHACSCTGSVRSEPVSVTNEHSLYLFGDTSKSLIIDNIRESIDEDLMKIILNCFRDINLDIKPHDVANIERIGQYVSEKARPRPVKVTFVEAGTRDQVLYFKSRLKYSRIFKEFKISKEEPREVRVKRAKLRQASLIAQNKGLDVFVTYDYIMIEGITYNLENVDDIPVDLTIDRRPSRGSPPTFQSSLSPFLKCRRKAEKITFVGPSLLKTVKGLAFSSANCFLSNFYPCQVVYRGNKFICTEQGYQFLKAKKYKNERAMREIMEAHNPEDMKRTGDSVVTDAEWEREKLFVMEELLWAKFRQNKEIYCLLMNTRPHNLIESTLDLFWGAGCKFGSIALEEGSWEGENHLGRMLMYIRKKFELEMNN